MSEHSEPTAGPPAQSGEAGANSMELGAVDLGAVDLDAVERDLADVEAALRRLAEGTYWTDEVTGEPLPDDLLVTDPTARRV